MFQYRSSIYIDPSDSASVKSVQVGNQRQDQIRYLQDQLQVIIQYNEKMEKEHIQLRNSLKEKDKQIAESQDINQKQVTKLTVLLSENEKLQDIVVNTNKQLKFSQAKTQQLMNENNQLKFQLQQAEELHFEEMRKRTTELEEHYQLMQQIVGDLTGQVKQLCIEKEQLQKELEDKHEQ